ncbi:MAG: hypothetical protein JSV92_01015 [archaeon]|nr:MAG: hypothetical protein JSV92_01015 [archaeon]
MVKFSFLKQDEEKQRKIYNKKFKKLKKAVDFAFSYENHHTIIWELKRVRKKITKSDLTETDKKILLSEIDNFFNKEKLREEKAKRAESLFTNLSKDKVYQNEKYVEHVIYNILAPKIAKKLGVPKSKVKKAIRSVKTGLYDASAYDADKKTIFISNPDAKEIVLFSGVGVDREELYKNKGDKFLEELADSIAAEVGHALRVEYTTKKNDIGKVDDRYHEYYDRLGQFATQKAYTGKKFDTYPEKEFESKINKFYENGIKLTKSIKEINKTLDEMINLKPNQSSRELKARFDKAVKEEYEARKGFESIAVENNVIGLKRDIWPREKKERLANYLGHWKYFIIADWMMKKFGLEKAYAKSPQKVMKIIKNDLVLSKKYNEMEKNISKIKDIAMKYEHDKQWKTVDKKEKQFKDAFYVHQRKSEKYKTANKEEKKELLKTKNKMSVLLPPPDPLEEALKKGFRKISPKKKEEKNPLWEDDKTGGLTLQKVPGKLKNLQKIDISNDLKESLQKDKARNYEKEEKKRLHSMHTASKNKDYQLQDFVDHRDSEEKSQSAFKKLTRKKASLKAEKFKNTENLNKTIERTPQISEFPFKGANMAEEKKSHFRKLMESREKWPTKSKTIGNATDTGAQLVYDYGAKRDPWEKKATGDAQKPKSWYTSTKGRLKDTFKRNKENKKEEPEPEENRNLPAYYIGICPQCGENKVRNLPRKTQKGKTVICDNCGWSGDHSDLGLKKSDDKSDEKTKGRAKCPTCGSRNLEYKEESNTYYCPTCKVAYTRDEVLPPPGEGGLSEIAHSSFTPVAIAAFIGLMIPVIFGANLGTALIAVGIIFLGLSKI